MRRAVFVVFGLAVLAGCSRKTTYHTTVELTRVHAFGKDPKAPAIIDIELRYSECPGNARKLIRGDKEFAACAVKYKPGAKVSVDVVATYVPDRGSYRSEIVKVGDCTLKTDPKDEVNYERIEECTDLKMTGAAVGVHCDRKRNPALVAKCPWLRR